MPLAITYRTAGAWGAGIGVNLTPAQVDVNFYELANWIETFEPEPPNGIANIVQEGSVITFYLDNAESFAVTLPSAPAIVPFVEKTAATMTLSIDDRNTFMNCSHASGMVVTIPLDIDSTIPLHAEFHFRQDGTGPITLDVPTDITVNGIAGFDLATNKAGAVFTLKHTDVEDVWVMFGLLAPTEETATA